MGEEEVKKPTEAEVIGEYVTKQLPEELQVVAKSLKDGAPQETVMRHLASYAARRIAEKFPGSITAARWVQVQPKREGSFSDKGWFVSVVEAPIPLGKIGKLKLTVGGLIGMKSAGVAVMAPGWGTDRVVVQVGAGLVTPYADIGKMRVVAAANVRVRL